jgi:hypothetical protein
MKKNSFRRKSRMPNYNIKISTHSRVDILNYIQKKKSEGPFTVIDVGGSMNGWSAGVIDALVDFNPPQISNGKKQYQCDITHPKGWNEVLTDVERNGKYDFCICTHTLEDIMNPKYVCEQMEKIAKAGYIAVPSKYKELSRFECGSTGYRGYIHHRWIFDITDKNILKAYPKINCIEHLGYLDQIADNSEDKVDLSFYWNDSIHIEYLNNNYLGPNVESVLEYYKDLGK